MRVGLVVAALVWAAAGCATTGTLGTSELERPAEDISFTDLQGQPIRLSDFRGKVVLLDFWATWCAPCAESLPVYARWQEELGPRGLQVLAVSVDEGTDAPVATFAEKYARGLKVARDPQGRAAGAYDLPTMPTAFVIDRTGRVVARHAGFETASVEELRRAVFAALDR